MSPCSAISCNQPSIEIGSFSWPLVGPGKGNSSPAAVLMLGAAVENSEDFKAQLEPNEAARYEQVLSSGSCFRIELTLRNGRQIAMTASVDRTPPAGLVQGILEDASNRPAEAADLMAREELCRAVAENSPALLWIGDEKGKCVFLNQAQRDFWGVDPEDLSTFDWSSTTHKDDIEKLSGPFMTAMAQQTPFSVAARYRAADGQYRTLRTQANPRFDRDGRFLGMTGVNTDITDQLAAEEKTRLLMGELNHRTKNILTVVQAIARQTARHAAPEEFGQIFNKRLLGLAASNDLLLRSEWTGVELAELVQVQLQPLDGMIGERILVEGPRLRIASTAAQALGMALHELATNSLKYGALAEAQGLVELKWEVQTQQEGAGFSLRWIESGVSNVSPPDRRGFGHTIITDMVASAFETEVQLRFEPDGLKWGFTALKNYEPA